MLTQLEHNGIIIAPKPPRHYLTLTVRGEPMALSAKQEEMAVAWARKIGTPYVDDRTFARNFMTDLSGELGVSPRLKVEEVDFGPAILSSKLIACYNRQIDCTFFITHILGSLDEDISFHIIQTGKRIAVIFCFLGGGETNGNT